VVCSQAVPRRSDPLLKALGCSRLGLVAPFPGGWRLAAPLGPGPSGALSSSVGSLRAATGLLVLLPTRDPALLACAPLLTLSSAAHGRPPELSARISKAVRRAQDSSLRRGRRCDTRFLTSCAGRALLVRCLCRHPRPCCCPSSAVWPSRVARAPQAQYRVGRLARLPNTPRCPATVRPRRRRLGSSAQAPRAPTPSRPPPRGCAARPVQGRFPAVPLLCRAIQGCPLPGCLTRFPHAE